MGAQRKSGRNEFAFKGFIDEVAIYRRALSAGEIQQIHSDIIKKFQTSQIETDVQVEVDAKKTSEEPVDKKLATDNSLEIISVVPNSPAILKLGEKLHVDIRYQLRSFTDVQIWARPYTKGRRASGYRAHGSRVYHKTDSETGIAKGSFYFDKATTIDEIRIRMKDKNTEEIQTASYKIDARWIDVNSVNTAGQTLNTKQDDYLTEEQQTRGKTVIPGTYTWDIEKDKLSGSTGTDLWWQQVDSRERYLVPRNGAEVSRVLDRDFETIDLQYLEKVKYSDEKISGSDEVSVLTPGAVIALKTSEGNLAKIKVIGIERKRQRVNNIKLEWVLFRNSSVHAQKFKGEISPQELATAHLQVEEIRKRLESGVKLSELGKALLIYANDSDEKYPDDVNDLRPYSREENVIDWALENVEYLGKGKDVTIQPQAVIAYDKKMLTEKGETNVLFNDSHVEFCKAKRLKELEIEKTQIAIEAKILLIGDGMLERIMADPNVKYITADRDANTYSGVIDDYSASFIMKATQKYENSKMLTAPKVNVLDSETAYISITKGMAYIADYNEPNATGLFAMFAKPVPIVKTIKSGIDLKVLPKRLDDGQNILLEVDLEYLNIVDLRDYTYKGKYPFQIPETESVMVKSKAAVPDGGTLALGGQKITTKGESGVEHKQNLIVLIRPTVIDK